MKSKRSLPSPISILMMVIVAAALATILIPAGQYNRLSFTDGHFQLVSKDTSINLPPAQQTLDSLHIRIPLEKFQSGAI
ncbi:MAG: hypothetical protein U0T68_04520, partial [Ferruginibacter sp.]